MNKPNGKRRKESMERMEGLGGTGYDEGKKT